MLLRHRVNWTAVCDAVGELPWRSIWSAGNAVERLNVNLFQLVKRFVPSKVIHVHNKGKPWISGDYRYRSTSSRRLIFGVLVIALEVTDEFVYYQRRSNEVYAEAGRQLRARNRDDLMNAQCPHKWWSFLKSAVFGSVQIPLFLLLLGRGGGRVCESVRKSEMLSDHFDRKQSRDPVDMPSTYLQGVLFKFCPV